MDEKRKEEGETERYKILSSGKHEPTSNQQSTAGRPGVSEGSGGLSEGSWRATIYAKRRRGAIDDGRSCEPWSMV